MNVKASTSHCASMSFEAAQRFTSRVMLLLLLLFYSHAVGRNYFINSLTGKNSFSGLSPDSAFLSISSVEKLLGPGDTVFIMNGTYGPGCTGCDVLDITRSGTLNNWIVIKNYKGQSPVILFDAWNGIRISGGASFIEINGLIIRGNSANIKLSDALNQPGGCNNPAGTVSGVYNGNGITIDGSQGGHCHHVRIKNTTVYECPSAGIGSVQCDYITIDSCFIYNNCWYTLFGTSGIDLFQNWNVDNASGYHNFVTHNKSFGNRLYVPWVAAPCQIKDGNGIIIDGSKFSNNGAGYSSRTLVAYNIVAGNGGSGIHAYRSAHVDIVNNTAYQNAQSAEINYGEIFASLSTDVAFYNNILDALPNKKLNSYLYVNDTNIRYDYNLHFGGTGPAEIVGPHTIVSDPLFTNPSTDMATADFSLKKGSPAIAKGLELSTILLPYNWPKPANAAPDIGAVMYQGGSIGRKIIAPIATYSIPRSFIGNNQVLIRAKPGNTNVQGKIVLEKSERNALRH